MRRREPVQKRSRERIEQILLAGADVLAKTGNADDLTTTSVSKRSGIPVATVYRYFADRVAIIATLIDRETAEIDVAINEAIDSLETVSLATLLDTLMWSHLRHFQQSKRSVVLWFGARQSAIVLGRVDGRYKYMADWIFNGSLNAGLAVKDAPVYGGGMIIWLCDRIFEFIFREERTIEEQEAIMREFLEMQLHQIHKYATPSGLAGIPKDEFLAKAGTFAPSYRESAVAR